MECEAAVLMGNGSFVVWEPYRALSIRLTLPSSFVVIVTRMGLRKSCRIRPSILSGEGAYRYAKERGLQSAAPGELASHHVDGDMYKRWQHYKAMVEAYGAGTEPQRAHKSDASNDKQDNESKRAQEDDITEILLDRPDTVGAITCDFEGRVSAALSSGGIWLKVPGRHGCSSSFGSGRGAVNGEGGNPSVASSVSGCGEDITEQLLAFRTCDALKAVQLDGVQQPHFSSHIDDTIIPPSSLHSVMKGQHIKRMYPRSGTGEVKKCSKNDAGSVDVINEGIEFPTGVIALQARRTTDNMLRITFCCAHTSPHLAIGVASAHHPTADA